MRKASFLENKNTTFTIDADGNVTVKNASTTPKNNEGKEQKQY